MATRKELEKVVAKYGAEIDSHAEHFLCIDQPKGKVWTANGEHCIVVHFENPVGQRWTQEAFDDAIDRMNYGVEECTDPNCDYCHPIEEEESK